MKVKIKKLKGKVEIYTDFKPYEIADKMDDGILISVIHAGLLGEKDTSWTGYIIAKVKEGCYDASSFFRSEGIEVE